MRTNTTAPTLTRAAFTAWLAQFPDECEVGIPEDDTQCPIARYMTETFQPESVSVCESDMLTVVNGDEYVQTNAHWAAAFIDLIDDFEGIVNAGTAREILARIPGAEVRS